MYAITSGKHETIDAAMAEAMGKVNEHISLIWEKHKTNSHVNALSHQIIAVYGGYVCTVFYSFGFPPDL